jgi:lambda repressor-like predicted transcriptional regulator
MSTSGTDAIASAEQGFMHKEDIRAGIRKSFGTLEKAAAEYGVCRQFMNSVLKGEKRSERVERAIAATLGKCVEEVFPERYPQTGESLR